MSTQHTPTPWYLHGDQIRDAEGNTIARLAEWGPQSNRPNGQAEYAALILARVNSHDALVEILRGMLDARGCEHVNFDGSHVISFKWMQQVHAALKAATEPQS